MAPHLFSFFYMNIFVHLLSFTYYVFYFISTCSMDHLTEAELLLIFIDNKIDIRKPY